MLYIKVRKNVSLTKKNKKLSHANIDVLDHKAFILRCLTYAHSLIVFFRGDAKGSKGARGSGE